MSENKNATRNPASFRDPSGLVFERDGTLYRQVNTVYQSHYDRLMGSKLYDELVSEGMLIPHSEGDLSLAQSEGAYKVLIPERVPFLSYPYEWSFSQIKDAALATLTIQRLALEKGMTLKDASAYNIQFVRGKPVLIDTQSFEVCDDGKPWVAYRQFCQHFLAPLAVMAYCDIELRRLSELSTDGLPLSLACKLLPLRAKWKPGLFVHLVLHSRMQDRYASDHTTRVSTPRKGSKTALLGLISHLEKTIQNLIWKPAGTEWGEYYSDTNYTPTARDHKRDVVREWTTKVAPNVLWDIGGNTGFFNKDSNAKTTLTVSLDIDPAAIEKLYRVVRANHEEHVLPLIMDLTNPSCDSGWGHRERMSLERRGPADLVLALALIHHLAIPRNVPFELQAAYFAKIARSLIIEFVPKTDSQVKKLLANREDVFTSYTQKDFEDAFGNYFKLEQKIPVKESERTLYLYRPL